MLALRKYKWENSGTMDYIERQIYIEHINIIIYRYIVLFLHFYGTKLVVNMF